MHPEAVGWDWIGMNLDNGGALTAFRLRRQDGSALWASGSFRGGADAALQVFEDGQAVAFAPCATGPARAPARATPSPGASTHPPAASRSKPWPTTRNWTAAAPPARSIGRA